LREGVSTTKGQGQGAGKESLSKHWICLVWDDGAGTWAFRTGDVYGGVHRYTR
jgi:hypothetical protein